MRCQPAAWLQAEAPRWGVEEPPDGEATERIRSNQGVAVWSSAHTVRRSGAVRRGAGRAGAKPPCTHGWHGGEGGARLM